MVEPLGAVAEIGLLRSSDARDCVEVVRSLPGWFSYPGALDDVASATSSQEGFCARVDGQLVGFVTVRLSFAESLEITYLAVHAMYRNKGIGSQLVRAVARLCKERSIELICLLTLGPTAGSSFYEETVAFYRASGFWRVRELQNAEWGGAYSLVMTALASRLLEAESGDGLT